MGKMSQKKILHEGKYLRVVEKGTWQYVERTTGNDVCYIIPVTKEKEVVFIREYRIPFDKYVVGFPAGLVGDIGPEEVSTAAARELEEETGYAGQLKLMTKGPPSSGLASELIHFYVATECVKVSAGGGDDSENISVFKVPFNEVHDWLDKQAGDSLIDPKAYLGLYFIHYFNLA